MYFWRIEELKSKMKSGPLTEREVLPYLLIFLMLIELIPLSADSEKDIWDYALIAYCAVLTVFGTIYLYRQNGDNGGVHFLQRYLVLSWVVTIRMMAVVMPVSVALGIFLIAPSEGSQFWFGAMALFYLAYFQRMGKHMRDVANGGATV